MREQKNVDSCRVATDVDESESFYRDGLRHLLKLRTCDAYDRGKLGVGGARRDGRQFPTTGRAGAGGGVWW